jgi:hypothetical protein
VQISSAFRVVVFVDVMAVGDILAPGVGYLTVDALIATCEGCHQQYKPSIPTEGYRKRH